jgi:hypothetical protein
MGALALTVSVFGFFLVVGLALLALFPPRLRLLTTVLTAPAAGLAVTEVLLSTLSRCGWPVGRFATPLFAAQFAAAVVVLCLKRPLLVLRRSLPVLGLILASLLLAGWPMFSCGFRWLSYCNEDMANYCLSAQRLQDHGYYDPPSQEVLDAGRDGSAFCWYLQVGIANRPGSELVLALASSVTGRTPHQVFMPVILAFNAVLLAAAAALAYQSSRSYRVALLTCGLLAVSSLTTLGVLYQVIAQVGGVALLLANVLLLVRPLPKRPLPSLLGTAVPAGILLAGLLIHYSEIVPFLVLTYGVWIAVEAVRRRHLPYASLGVLGGGTLLCVLVLNLYFFEAALYVVQQLHGVAGADPDGVAQRIEVFPYFVIPSGLAQVWGVEELTRLSPEPALSLKIVAGAALLVGVGLFSLRQALRGMPLAMVNVVMLAMGLYLLRKQAAFGLFKLAMFAQPALLGCLALAAVRLARWRGLAVVALTVLTALAYGNLAVQRAFVAYSFGKNTFAEVYGASGTDMLSEFRALAGSSRKVVLDTNTIVLAKFQAAALRGIDTLFLSFDPFANMTSVSPPHLRWGFDYFQEGAAGLARHARAAQAPAAFRLHDPARPSLIDPFVMQQPAAINAHEEGACLLAMPAAQSIFNRRHAAGDPRQFRALPLAQVANHLVFVDSGLGHPPFFFQGGGRTNFALSQAEGDYFYPDRSMQALGRFLLFEVLNPTPRFRAVLDCTASLKADGQSLVPPAQVIGSVRVALPARGRGSARLVSPPLEAQQIAGRYFICLDLGAEGTYFPFRRTGLNRLYKGDLNPDRRPVTAFGRNVSVLTEEEYARMEPPAALAAFPRDLANPDLEYTGLYEDGCVAETAVCKLRRPSSASRLVVKGQILPATPASEGVQELVIRVDGVEVARQQLTAGAFELSCAAAPAVGPQEVELHFSRARSLSEADRRPAAARLTYLGFE